MKIVIAWLQEKMVDKLFMKGDKAMHCRRNSRVQECCPITEKSMSHGLACAVHDQILYYIMCAK